MRATLNQFDHSYLWLIKKAFLAIVRYFGTNIKLEPDYLKWKKNATVNNKNEAGFA